ncbi:Com family DNA-binding transcriptional regulator [Desulfovibrio cuneatus]|uniref:Com family DNA-binding transcriptional regulator n=1 Tax=Desulfovibrio cuneatus TaxID=159728 RepID=UPI000A06B574|nr:Com family DNA-binding transcriptional regulator [Desulfovibrio cuneatus]
MPEIRCGHCHRLLAKGTALSITIKCPRCATLNHITSGAGSPAQTAKPMKA